MRGRTVFAIVGWGLLAVALVGFVLRGSFLWETGGDLGYRNYKHQPMTYLGTFATLGIAGLIGVVGLYYRVKRRLQQRSERRQQKN